MNSVIIPSNLTDAWLRKLKPIEPMDFGDKAVKGLRMVAKPNGTRSWYIRYTFKDKVRKATIGAYPATGLAAARKRALELLELRREGINPKDHLDALRAPEEPTRTFGEWLDTWCKCKPPLE